MPMMLNMESTSKDENAADDDCEDTHQTNDGDGGDDKCECSDGR